VDLGIEEAVSKNERKPGKFKRLIPLLERSDEHHDVTEAELIEALFVDLGIEEAVSKNVFRLDKDVDSKDTYENIIQVIARIQNPELNLLPAGTKPRILIYATSAQVARTVSAMIVRLQAMGLSDWEFMVKSSYHLNLEKLSPELQFDFIEKSIGVPRWFMDQEKLRGNKLKAESEWDRIISHQNVGSDIRPPFTVRPLADSNYPGGVFTYRGGHVGYRYNEHDVELYREGFLSTYLKGGAQSARSDVRHRVAIFQAFKTWIAGVYVRLLTANATILAMNRVRNAWLSFTARFNKPSAQFVSPAVAGFRNVVGTYMPLFQMRSKADWGVVSYDNMKLAVRYHRETGQNVIQ
jgi:hypothetical protein